MTKRKNTISKAGMVVFESLTNNEAMAKRIPDAVVRKRPRPDLKNGGQHFRLGDGEETRFDHKGNVSAIRCLQVWLMMSPWDAKFRKLSLSLSNEKASAFSWIFSR